MSDDATGNETNQTVEAITASLFQRAEDSLDLSMEERATLTRAANILAHQHNVVSQAFNTVIPALRDRGSEMSVLDVRNSIAEYTMLLVTAASVLRSLLDVPNMPVEILRSLREAVTTPAEGQDAAKQKEATFVA